MSRFRIHNSFEEELAKKADEFSMQPSKGLWNAVDQNVQQALFKRRLVRGATLGTTLAVLVAGIWLFNSPTEERIAEETPFTKFEAPSGQATTPLFKKETPNNIPPSESDRISYRNVEAANALPTFTPVSQTTVSPSEEQDKLITRSIAPKHLAFQLNTETSLQTFPNRKPRRNSIQADGWHLQASFTPTFAYRQVSAKTDYAKPLAEQKAQSDEGVLGFRARLSGRYYFTDRVSVAVGLAYTQNGESIGMDARRESPVYEALAEQYDYELNSIKTPGNKEFFTNRYRYIEVPVMIYSKKQLSSR
ncbi:MAG: hypothetical protein LPK45_08780, partial [Bacteroidota bacterium]|nr:hypothetical protein [Bacteroidota bacterium]MDX5431179.1 hypothetical protein [Bacteroidota bacterium]MDX5469918.1 hypothetical protein [Bacteroidota bacterium]